MARTGSRGGSKRWGRPARRAVRHLITVETAKGYRYYWTPPSRLRSLEGRPAWLKSQALGAALPEAIIKAEEMNAKLDAWRGNRQAIDGISALVVAYLASDQFAKLKDRTKTDYRRHLDAIRQDFADSGPRDVTHVVVVAYQDGLARSGLSARQITYRLQVLRLLFSWGKHRGHVDDNPAEKLQLSAKPKRPPRIWTLADINRMMDAPYPVGLAAALALFTVQRQGDIAAMRWSDIIGGMIRVEQGKTGKIVVLPIHPHLQAALAAAPRRGETILATRTGPYTQDGLRAMWARVAPKGSPTFHDIRRTATTWLRAAGLRDEDVVLWTGHGRQRDGAILDTYDLRLGDLARLTFPIMDGWRVQNVDSRPGAKVLKFQR